MDFKQIQKQFNEWYASLKKHSLGNEKMKRSTYLSMQKFIAFIVIGFLAIVVMVAKVIVPGVYEINELQDKIDNHVKAIYGEGIEKIGKEEEEKNLKERFTKKEEEFLKKQEKEVEELKQAMWKEDKIYELITYLEDYAITVSKPDNPIIITRADFGKVSDKKIAAKDLKQKVELPIKKEDLQTILGLKEQNWPENIYDLIMKNESEDYFFKADTEENSFKSLENPQIREGLKRIWLKAPKISINAEYRVMPLNISLEGTAQSFENFIEFVYHSGSTKDYLFKGKAVPIMSIESLNIPTKHNEEMTFETEEEDEIKTENYTVKMNVYFQKSTAKEEKPEKK
jgi:hypothetical protein